MKCVGGPWDGEDIDYTAGVLWVGNLRDMEYVSTLPTDTDWRSRYDPDWFMHGLREAPPIPDRVYEWHERGWQSPEVRMIRGAVEEASARLR